MDIKDILFNFLLGQLSDPFVQEKHLRIGIEMIVKLLLWCSSWFRRANINIPNSLLNLTLNKFKTKMEREELYVVPVLKNITVKDEHKGTFYTFGIYDTVITLLKSDKMALNKLKADKIALYHNTGN